MGFLIHGMWQILKRLLEHFIERKPLIYEEWLCSTTLVSRAM